MDSKSNDADNTLHNEIWDSISTLSVGSTISQNFKSVEDVSNYLKFQDNINLALEPDSNDILKEICSDSKVLRDTDFQQSGSSGMASKVQKNKTVKVEVVQENVKSSAQDGAQMVNVYIKVEPAVKLIVPKVPTCFECKLPEVGITKIKNDKNQPTNVDKDRPTNVDKNRPTNVDKNQPVLPVFKSVKLGYLQPMRKPSGLFNMGNSCYMNCVLQALFHIPAFVNMLLDETSCCKAEDNISRKCIICIMRHTMVQMYSRSGDIYLPNEIYAAILKLNKHFVPKRQEDAHELLRCLLCNMEKAYMDHYNPMRDFIIYEPNPIGQIFGGVQQTEVFCKACENRSTREEIFLEVNLDIRTSSTLFEALKSFYNGEVLQGSSAYFCTSCSRKVTAEKTLYITKPPNVYCIQLKRYTTSTEKITKPVTFSKDLDLNCFLKQRQIVPLLYRLMAVIVHHGKDAESGHYTAIGRASDGSYHSYDDQNVEELDNTLQSSMSDAYMLFYELMSPEIIVTRTFKKTLAGDSGEDANAKIQSINMKDTSPRKDHYKHIHPWDDLGCPFRLDRQVYDWMRGDEHMMNINNRQWDTKSHLSNRSCQRDISPCKTTKTENDVKYTAFKSETKTSPGENIILNKSNQDTEISSKNPPIEEEDRQHGYIFHYDTYSSLFDFPSGFKKSKPP